MSETLQYSSNWLKHVRDRNAAIRLFFDAYQGMAPRDRHILEAGTRVWERGSTHHQSALEPYATYLMIDAMDGQDVDKVADLHALPFEDESFSVFWASSVWEHLHSPWRAADEVLRVLKPGGVFFIQTHQTFPVHGYPHDYFRFSKEALAHLFSAASRTATDYEFPCQILPPPQQDIWNYAAESYLNVCVAGVK